MHSTTTTSQPHHPSQHSYFTTNTANARIMNNSSSSSSRSPADVLQDGDLVGPGLALLGEQIHDVFPAASQPDRHFRVIRKLGTGSYAVVYLVREIPTDDGPEFDDWETDVPQSKLGQEYAVKVLSKANLDEDALDSQRVEATIHQAIPQHPNIVTLHRTFESKSFLLLLLEFVPGEDLFYFLEQARDHDPAEIEAGSSSSYSGPSSATPPTPSLLSNLHPSQLLSHTRLRLIASMFGQMCDAVAAVHDAGVFHRDIKPENFIVSEARENDRRRVVVKLTDFGLSTTDEDSPDMDCGSAPYMSFECRNNCAPTYSTRAADVWSLGIVLINMLYHHNPWTDTAVGACHSFEMFRAQPVSFFMQRFAGMTPAVAEFLACHVFCILKPGVTRVSVRELGRWARDELPALLAPSPGINTPGHRRQSSASTTIAHPIGSIPCSRRPSSRVRSRIASRAPSVERAPALLEEDGEQSILLELENEVDDVDSPSPSRTPSAKDVKRRKRGARKGKGKANEVPPSDALLDELAAASQVLAREISQASKGKPTSPVEAPSQRPTLTKKPSKWKDMFRVGNPGSPTEEVPPLPPAPPKTTTADNVSSLIMGLSAPSVASGSEAGSIRGRKSTPNLTSSSTSSSASIPDWRRTGPRGASPTSTRASSSVNWRNSTATSSSAFTRFSNSSARSVSTVATSVSASSSWRNASQSQLHVNKLPPPPVPSSSQPPSVAGPPSKASQRGLKSPLGPPPSNVKIMNGMPWALHELPRQLHPQPVGDIFGSPPVRQKREKMPSRSKPPKESSLGTISEWPQISLPSSPLAGPPMMAIRADAATSTTDLHRDRDSPPPSPTQRNPKKVQKGQINSLAKMLNALRL